MSMSGRKDVIPVSSRSTLAADSEERIDPAVVASLYVEYGDELRGFLVGVLRDAELAGEAFQATFAKTMEAGHTAREETLKGWLFRVAFNEAMGLRRRQKVNQKSLKKLAENQTGPSPPSPEDPVTRWETVSKVRDALNRLPEEQRQIVCLRIYEEKKFAVIAEELDLPLGTVLTRMRAALKKLSGHLQDENQQ